MTRISEIGRLTRISNFRSKGFSLLELLVVIAILSTAILIIFPRIYSIDDFVLNSEARRIAGLFRYLDEKAHTKKIYCRVLFYLEKESLDVEYSTDGIGFKKEDESFAKGFALKHGIDIQDIIISGLGKITHGEASVVFNPVSGGKVFNLHLKKGERLLTIYYNQYSGRTKIKEGYV